MSSTGNQDVHVHLPCQSGEGIHIARRNTLLTVNDPKPQRALIYRQRQRKMGVLDRKAECRGQSVDGKGTTHVIEFPFDSHNIGGYRSQIIKRLLVAHVARTQNLTDLAWNLLAQGRVRRKPSPICINVDEPAVS